VELASIHYVSIDAMTRLDHSTQDRFQNLAAGLYEQHQPVALVSYLLSGLQTLISTDYNSWKEITLQGRSQVTGVFFPHNPAAASLLPVFQRHVDNHPICNYWRRSGKHDGALSWADIARQSAFQSLPLYKEFYRPLSIHHQLMVALEVRPSSLIYVALNRSRTPFTEQDRHMLAMLQPHASHALRHLREQHHLRSTLVSFETLIDTLSQGIACLSPQNRIRWASKRARTFLRTYWPDLSDTTCLPDALLAWLLKSLKATAATKAARRPLYVQRPSGRLTIRLLVEKSERYLFFEEAAMEASLEPLKQIGLTDREAEVLKWVAQGKSNEDTAAILNVCSQTVKKHLERIYSALGVTNRTEAALKTHDLLRHSNEP